MKELRPLGSESPNPLTRALLAAGRDDAPSPDARAAAAIAVGVAAGLATTAAAGGAAAGTATGTAVASKWLGGLGLLKLVGATVVTTAVVVGAVHEQRQLRAPVSAPSTQVVAAAAVVRARPSMPVPLPAPAATTPPQVEAEAAPSVIVEPTTTFVPAPLAHTARSALRQTPHAAASRDVTDATLGDEVLRLDRARANVAEGHHASALAELAAYDRAFPKGALAYEAELLRIETLAQLGDVVTARARAERLLAREGHGPLARRVRALLASLPDAVGAR